MHHVPWASPPLSRLLQQPLIHRKSEESTSNPSVKSLTESTRKPTLWIRLQYSEIERRGCIAMPSHINCASSLISC